MSMRVASLHIYPLKSGRGINLDQADVALTGLSGDRRLMLTGPDGHFITQRELPALARISVSQTPDETRLTFDDGRMVAFQGNGHSRMDVAVWKSIVNAATVGPEVDTALSEWLGRPVRLAVFDAQASRFTSRDWPGAETPVTFADGYQILVTTTASLDALNADMEKHGEGSVGMDRFRPNIVIDQDVPFAEDGWAAIDIGGLRFDLVKPCARCVMTTQDQATGSREGANPMPAMGRLRFSTDRRVPGPIFGWNAVPRGCGTIRTGDEVRIVETNDARWPLKPPRD